MSTHDPSRRQFIKAASVGAAGLTLAPASSYARILGANDRVRVGVVGFSDRLRGALIPAFQKHAQELNFELVAVSDIWSKRRDDAAAISRRTTSPSRSSAATTTSCTIARTSTR